MKRCAPLAAMLLSTMMIGCNNDNDVRPPPPPGIRGVACSFQSEQCDEIVRGMCEGTWTVVPNLNGTSSTDECKSTNSADQEVCDAFCATCKEEDGCRNCSATVSDSTSTCGSNSPGIIGGGSSRSPSTGAVTFERVEIFELIFPTSTGSITMNSVAGLSPSDYVGMAIGEDLSWHGQSDTGSGQVFGYSLFDEVNTTGNDPQKAPADVGVAFSALELTGESSLTGIRLHLAAATGVLAQDVAFTGSVSGQGGVWVASDAGQFDANQVEVLDAHLGNDVVAFGTANGIFGTTEDVSVGTGGTVYEVALGPGNEAWAIGEVASGEYFVGRATSSGFASSMVQERPTSIDSYGSQVAVSFDVGGDEGLVRLYDGSGAEINSIVLSSMSPTAVDLTQVESGLLLVAGSNHLEIYRLADNQLVFTLQNLLGLVPKFIDVEIDSSPNAGHYVYVAGEL